MPNCSSITQIWLDDVVPNTNLMLPAAFQEAVTKANEIENQVQIFLSRIHPNYDYKMVVHVAIFTAQHAKSVIPMYTGNLNPKWELYDTVIKVLNGRLNGT